VVATDAADADAVWQALLADASLDAAASEAAPGARLSVFVPAVALDEDDEPTTGADAAQSVAGATAAADRPLLGGYRAHPVYTPNVPAGRVLVHALRLLEEDPLSDMDDAARAGACTAAVGYALAEEAKSTPWEARLTVEAVDAFLALDASNGSSPAPTAGSTHAAPEALLVLDAARGALATARGGLPLILVRAGRPALLAVAAGETSASARALVDLLVATFDLGEPLSGTLAQAEPRDAALAMMLDERGRFQAAGTSSAPIHVRGYERDEAS
jgi:hypothetical protein